MNNGFPSAHPKQQSPRMPGLDNRPTSVTVPADDFT